MLLVVGLVPAVFPSYWSISRDESCSHPMLSFHRHPRPSSQSRVVRASGLACLLHKLGKQPVQDRGCPTPLDLANICRLVFIVRLHGPNGIVAPLIVQRLNMRALRVSGVFGALDTTGTYVSPTDLLFFCVHNKIIPPSLRDLLSPFVSSCCVCSLLGQAHRPLRPSTVHVRTKPSSG